MQVSSIANNKKQRTEQVPARRKWSDWSECSENCMKIRHRLNCDDLILIQRQSQEQQSKFPTANKTSTLNQNDNSIKVISNAKAQQFLAGREKRFASEDNDDYADDGDIIEESEGDDVDSCAQLLDTVKTFEQIPCSGGQCRPSRDLQMPVTTATTTAHPKHRLLPHQKGKFPLQLARTSLLF